MINLRTYQEYGYSYTHIAILIDKTNNLSDYEVGYKSSLDKMIFNGYLPSAYQVLTFKKAASLYPQFFKY